MSQPISLFLFPTSLVSVLSVLFT